MFDGQRFAVGRAIEFRQAKVKAILTLNPGDEEIHVAKRLLADRIHDARGGRVPLGFQPKCLQRRFEPGFELRRGFLGLRPLEDAFVESLGVAE